MARRPRKRGAKRPVRGRAAQSAQQESGVIPPPRQHLHNLPTQLTTFIGREQEIAEVKHLLATTRLLTLTGSGGCGKTRLALQTAADALKHYPDGVWIVELAPLADPAFVPHSVAAALDVPEQPARLLPDTLADYLRTKTLLLVLDNCEHLRAACQSLADHLLRASDTLRILATSREALGVEGESTYRVPPLRFPDVRQTPSVVHLAEYDAIRLFAERAALGQPGFGVTARNAPAIVQICQQLDGMPLAIEFAAARVAALSVEQIAARLDDRFRLLTAGHKKTLPRHQTLRATLDWSYGLLSEPERGLLRRLSIFAGGFTLEAAENVCAGEGVDDGDILDLLTRLVDKSLVMFDEREGEARYRLLESVRQYGQDRLLAAGEAAEGRTRHRAWYLGLAERAEARMHGPEQTMWLNRLEVEHDNLRAALGWSSTEEEDAETRVRLAAALREFWDFHTHWGEGRKWLETALAGSRHRKSTDRVRALYGEGRLAWRQGDYARSMALYAESLALARDLGDQNGIAMALGGRGLVAELQGDFDAATALCEESLELSRNLDDQHWIAVVLNYLGMIAIRRKGDYAKAVMLCEESLAMFRTLGGKRWITVALRAAGHAARLQGDLKRAAGLYRESLTMFGEAGDKWVATECLEGLALIARAQGRPERAACLFGAAEAARETFGITMQRPEAGDQEGFWTAIRERPAETAFAVAWAEGRAMTLEQAIEYALASAGLEEPIGQQPPAKRPDGDPLTARERDVVRLVARGLTNREIAATLVVSGRTADAHVQNILNKLGFNSRAQIAAWVVERNLRTDREADTAAPDARPSQARRAT